MAKQKGILEIEGTIGELSFYKANGGFFVRRKSSVSKSRIKNDRAYARTRENMAEFATAARAGKLFRLAFRPLLQRCCIKGDSGRLMSAMKQVINEDQVNLRGQRTVQDGQPRLLEGFELNQNCALSHRLVAPFYASIDRANGLMAVDIPAFSPASVLSAPEGATHFCLFSGGATIDFETDTYRFAMAESACLPISKETTGPITLVQEVKTNSSGTLFLLLGIEFVKVENGVRHVLMNEGFGALGVVKVGNQLSVIGDR